MPSGRELEFAELLPVSAGKRSALVAEQRAFDELLGMAGEVHGDEAARPDRPLRDGSAAPAAPCRCRFRRGSGQSPTASAIFCTRSMMSRVILLDPTMNSRSVWSATCADRRHDLPVEVLTFARVAYERSELVVVEVFGDVVVGPVLHRLNRGLDVVDGRNHQDFDQGIVLFDNAQHFETADAGQAHIEQHQIDVCPD